MLNIDIIFDIKLHHNSKPNRTHQEFKIIPICQFQFGLAENEQRPIEWSAE